MDQFEDLDPQDNTPSPDNENDVGTYDGHGHDLGNFHNMMDNDVDVALASDYNLMRYPQAQAQQQFDPFTVPWGGAPDGLAFATSALVLITANAHGNDQVRDQTA